MATIKQKSANTPSKPTKKSNNLAKPKEKILSLPDIFTSAGFLQISSDGIHFDVKKRTGEIDFIFIFENVILLCEETAGANDVTGHYAKKKMFHGIISENPDDFFDSYCKANADFKSYVSSRDYTAEDLEIRQIYFSSVTDCPSSLFAHDQPLKIMRRSDADYFHSLTKIIGRSAKYELLKYLGVSLSKIGSSKASGAAKKFDGYDTFVLSGSHTNYPSGFGLVSFYADPASLISRAYVLRRDGWESAEISYQRFLLSSKLKEMRAYLSETKKVFVNNLIVTLPNHVQITDNESKTAVDLSKTFKGTATLHLPDELGTVGIIDGQHRIFSYHEGIDSAEVEVSKLRKRQNLLVTGIVFPKTYTESQRAKFEAELFLSINNTQTSIKADLRQELEGLINPSSTIAICKSVISQMARKGSLQGYLQEGLYAPPERIKTSSLVRYVLPSLIKMDASGSLYRVYSPDGTADMEDDATRIEYIQFCHTQINTVLSALASHLKARWKPRARDGVGILSPTTIGGFLLMIRDVIQAYEEDDDPLGFDFVAQLAGIGKFNFEAYTSSAWAQLGSKLSETYF